MVGGNLDLEKLKRDFEKEVGVPLYDAMEKFFGDYDSKLYCYDDDSATNIAPDDLANAVVQLKQLCRERTSRTEKLEKKHVKMFNKISETKCKDPDNARTSRVYTAVKPFLNEEIIKENLCKNGVTCWNPFSILRNPDDNCPCIFKPSKRLIEQYGKFLKRHYSGTTRIILYYEIDMNALKLYHKGDIIVEPEDIIELNWKLLHPFHWGLIQQNSFNLL